MFKCILSVNHHGFREVNSIVYCGEMKELLINYITNPRDEYPTATTTATPTAATSAGIWAVDAECESKTTYKKVLYRLN